MSQLGSSRTMFFSGFMLFTNSKLTSTLALDRKIDKFAAQSKRWHVSKLFKYVSSWYAYLSGISYAKTSQVLRHLITPAAILEP